MRKCQFHNITPLCWLLLSIATWTISIPLSWSSWNTDSSSQSTGYPADANAPSALPVSRNNYNNTNNQRKIAYASILGGVDPQKPAYRGFLYNLLIAAKILRAAGSRADIIVFFQMSHATNLEQLPQNDAKLLKAMQIKILYIPKTKHQNFYEITLEKFRILSLVEYERVLFLDADVMPLGNLDYLLDISADPSSPIKQNVVVAGVQEPSTAGFFFLAPGPGKWERLQHVVAERERKAMNLPFPKFNIQQGWGHIIRPPDRWETRLSTRSGNNWTFYSADADQGLLYEWAKYVEQNVSIIINNKVQNWGPGTNGYPILQEILERPFQNYSDRIYKWAQGPPPYRHFYHFTGRSKPWEGDMPSDLSLANPKKSPESFWFYHLLELNKEFHMFNANDWQTEREKMSAPPLGRFHVKADMASRVDRTSGK